MDGAGAATLVVLALVLTRSFVKLMAVDLGWYPERVLSLKVSPLMPKDRRPWYRYVEWSDRLIRRLEETPGIDKAAITSQIPLTPQSYSSLIARGRGKSVNDDVRWSGVQHCVTDGYFEAMDIRLVSGRTFSPADRFTERQLTGTAPRDHGAVVVTESTARLLWPGRPAGRGRGIVAAAATQRRH